MALIRKGEARMWRMQKRREEVEEKKSRRRRRIAKRMKITGRANAVMMNTKRCTRLMDVDDKVTME